MTDTLGFLDAVGRAETLVQLAAVEQVGREALRQGLVRHEDVLGDVAAALVAVSVLAQTLAHTIQF